jgi:SnoaL-like domain
VDDAVAQYRIASEANDIEALVDLLTPDAELVSPLSARMVFRGKEDLRALLTAVYGGMTGLRWREEFGDARHRLLIGDGRVGPLRMSDAMVFDLADDGRIRRIRPHLRPWLAVTLFALILGPKVARRPGVILRALAG